jgi:hypothetical protein
MPAEAAELEARAAAMLADDGSVAARRGAAAPSLDAGSANPSSDAPSVDPHLRTAEA